MKIDYVTLYTNKTTWGRLEQDPGAPISLLAIESLKYNSREIKIGNYKL